MKLNKFFFKSVTSTNDVALKKIKKGINSGIIISKKQTKGRGKYGNKWIYMKDNLFMSIFFILNEKISLKKITLISCKIVKKSLLNLLNKKIEIKQPNDLLVDKKKICGILQETIFYDNNKFVIIGVGINVEKSPTIKNYPTTHLNFYKKKKITNYKVYNEIKKNFEKYLKT